MRARVIIEIDDSGGLSVNAPQDKILVCGMLELAKYAILSKELEKRIIPVDLVLNPGGKG